MSDALKRDEIAAGWVAKLDRIEIGDSDNLIDALSAADEEFAQWVSASFENRTAFLRAQAAWSRADRLAALKLSTEVVHVRQRIVSPALIGTAAAACLAVVVAIVALQFSFPTGPQVFETAIGGRETVPLADGSKLELNTDTRLTADVREDVRIVKLEKGEAYFDITRDETRPFIVEAGEKRVTVLGTKFTVRRDGDDVEVIVAEGKVQIDGGNAEPSVEPTVVEKGVVVLARAEGTLIAEKSAAELNAELGWRQGLLIFDQMDLEAVAAEFNRYNRVKIEIGDANAAAIRIGGSFQAENVDAFARLLKDGFGLRIERIAEGSENKIVIKS